MNQESLYLTTLLVQGLKHTEIASVYFHEHVFYYHSMYVTLFLAFEQPLKKFKNRLSLITILTKGMVKWPLLYMSTNFTIHNINCKRSLSNIIS